MAHTGRLWEEEPGVSEGVHQEARPMVTDGVLKALFALAAVVGVVALISIVIGAVTGGPVLVAGGASAMAMCSVVFGLLSRLQRQREALLEATSEIEALRGQVAELDAQIARLKGE
jgi:outer membrane murein-binding lipoprotein Lpp